jgi:predicted O-methyltransferase YrrM
MQIDVDGVPARQNEHIRPALDRLVSSLVYSETVENIVEIGTYAGGFALLLRGHDLSEHANIYSYEVDPAPSEPYREILEQEDIEFLCPADVFETKWAISVALNIGRPGVSILFCDGGDKIREFHLFAPALKTGDLILAHDLGSEIRPEDVQDTCESLNLIPYLQEAFESSKWLIRMKK